LKNYFADIVITAEDAELFERLYDKIAVKKISFMDKFKIDLDKKGQLKSQVKSLLWGYFKDIYLSKEALSKYEGNEPLKRAYQGFVIRYFEDIYNDRLEFTKLESELTQPEKRRGTRSFENILEDRLFFTMFKFVMEKIGITEKDVDFENILENLEYFLGNKQDLEFEIVFNSETGKRLFLNTLTDTFLASPTHKNLQIDKTMNYFGYSKESECVFTKINKKTIEWFYKYASTLSEEELKEFEIHVSKKGIKDQHDYLYSQVSYNPANTITNYLPYDKINSLGIDWEDTNLYMKESKTSRQIDGPGELNLIKADTSTHIKSSSTESIMKSSGSYFDLSNELSYDTISAMIIKIKKRIVEDPSILDNLPTRINQLYASFKIPNDLSQTRTNAKEFFDKFYSKDSSSSLGNKLPAHEDFLIQVVKLINEELEYYKSETSTSIPVFSEKYLDAFVEDLFSKEDFKEEVIKIAENVGLNHFKTQLIDEDGFAQLQKLIFANLGKMVRDTSSGEVYLTLRQYYAPHFRTKQQLSIYDFPQGKVYILDDANNLIKVQHDEQLQGKGALIIGHDSSLPEGSIVLIPIKKLNDLSKTNVREGYKADDGKIYYDIFACDYNGLKLVSKLDFSEHGVKIRRRDWASDFYDLETTYDKSGNVISYESTFVAAYISVAGNDYKAGLQDTTINLEHLERADLPFPNKPWKKKGSTASLEIDKPQLKHSRIEEYGKEEQSKINALLGIIYQVIGIAPLSKTTHSEMYLTPQFFAIDGDEYSFSRLGEIVNVLLDKVAPEDVDNVLKKITQFLITNDGGIEKNKVSIKEFYQNWLELVKPLVSKDSILFPESKYKRLKELSFSSISSHLNVKGIEHKIIIDDASGYNDFLTLEEVDNFLIELLGYRPYALLKMGLLTFEKQEDGFNIVPMTHDIDFIYTILSGHNILGLNSLYRIQLSNFIISPSTARSSSIVMKVISSILLFGHYQHIVTFDKKGKLIKGNSIKGLKSLPNDKFLNKLFDNYCPTLMNFMEFGKLNNEFFDAFSQRKKSGKTFFTKIFVQNEGIEHFIISGWEAIYDIMYEALKSQIKKEYERDYKGDPYFEGKDPDYAIEHMVEFASIMIYEYIHNPTPYLKATKRRSPTGNNPILHLNNYLIERQQGLRQSDTIRIPFFFKTDNPVFSGGFELVLDAKKFTPELVSKIQLALYCSHYTRDFIKTKIDDILPEMKDSMIADYNELYDYLKDYEGESDGRFTVGVTRENQNGLSSKSPGLHMRVHNRLRDNDLKGLAYRKVTKFKFDRNKPDEFKQAVASIIYYVYKYKATVIITESQSHQTNYRKTVLIYSQKGALTPEYVMSSFGSDVITTIELSGHAKDSYKAKNGITARLNEIKRKYYPILAFNDAENFKKRLLGIFLVASGGENKDSRFSNIKDIIPLEGPKN